MYCKQINTCGDLAYHFARPIQVSLEGGEKVEILARMAAFNYCGINGKVLRNVVYHHQSFVGHAYKAWAQIALFIISPYLTEADKLVWIALSKVCM